MFNDPETIREEITLASGETAPARFNSWLAHQLATPRPCQKHPRTPLVLDRAHSGFREVYEEHHSWAPVHAEPKPKPGVFAFCAVRCCPACQCARAKCPPEFHETSFDTFATDNPERAERLAQARAFAAQVNEHGCGFAVLLGMTGNGKTRLACNIIRALDNPGALYARWGALTAALRATYGGRGNELRGELRAVQARLENAHAYHIESNRADRERERELEAMLENPLATAQDIRFLVLDELGAQALANDDSQLLDEIIKHRYDQRKPTMLISNLPFSGTQAEPMGFKQFVGDALYDRICEAAGGKRFILQFSGASYRRTSGESYLDGFR